MDMTIWLGVTKKWTQAMLALAVVYGLSGGIAFGAVIVDDHFFDGDVTDGADPLDVEWRPHRNGNETLLSAQNDNGPGQLNDGDAMLLDRSNNAVTGALADLPAGQRKLAEVGDFIKMEFDFRILANQLNNGFDGNVTNRGFRGGFFNRNGTPDDSEFPAGLNDDQGYFFQTGVGAIEFVSSSNDFIVNQEQGENNGPANGSDKATGPSGKMLSVINSEVPRSVVFTLTKTLLGVETAFEITGPDATGTSVTSSTSAEFYVGSPTGGLPAIDIDRFEYFGIFASKKPYDLIVDDFRITTNAPVPEPSSLALIGLGLTVLGLRRWH